LMDAGIDIIVSHVVTQTEHDRATIASVFTEQEQTLPIDYFVPVTSRIPNDQLYQALMARQDDQKESGIKKLIQIGDCEAPNLVLHAIYAGHEIGRCLDNLDRYRKYTIRDRAIVT
ncbi:MAG: hypothetical protein R3261_15095, partial [Alphaproteobacteria bacterium]|nr:hypothetical protein [Alphaproteobacteria bacterium]